MNDIYAARAGERAVFDMGQDVRAAFLGRTYTTLFGAIAAFVLLEVALFQTALPAAMFEFVGGGRYRWLLFLGGFMAVGWLASRMAVQARSPAAQYGALLLYVFFEALLFLPLLFIAQSYAGGGVIESAALVTLAAFAGLTAIVFVTRKDFSFLRGIVMYGMILALVAIVAGVVFGFALGTWFSVIMVALAGAAILYDTSNILHHYPPDKHVAAALQLFASVALMFWYVLQLFLSRD